MAETSLPSVVNPSYRSHPAPSSITTRIVHTTDRLNVGASGGSSDVLARNGGPEPVEEALEPLINPRTNHVTSTTTPLRLEDRFPSSVVVVQPASPSFSPTSPSCIDPIDISDIHHNDYDRPCGSITTMTTVTPCMVIEADDNYNESEDCCPLIDPLILFPASRNNDRTRHILAKFGFIRDPCPATNEPSSRGSNRVQKAPRLRLHWKCHECGSGFGAAKVCLRCAHCRCRVCLRSSSGRVDAHPNRDAEQCHNSTIITDSKTDTRENCHRHEDAPPGESQVAPTSPARMDLSMSPSPPALTHHEDAGCGARTSTDFQSDPIKQPGINDSPLSNRSINNLPALHSSTSPGYVFRSKARVVRHNCHKCNKPFSLPSQRTCQSCNHTRCDRCPRMSSRQQAAQTSSSSSSRRSTEITSDTMEPSQPPQPSPRVYRKARIRIRFTCDQCATLFTNSTVCQRCGHHRCPTCIRDPPKRPRRASESNLFRIINGSQIESDETLPGLQRTGDWALDVAATMGPDD